jgi:Holliday junction DNA helicase RuvA
MIARLKGIVDGLSDDSVVIDVGGVGYLVYCSTRTLSRLGQGDAVALEIETHVREDHFHLFGFMDAIERDWFRLLTTVQGVGARVGLAIMGALSSDQLIQAIAAGDKAAITQAPGVGPKLAVRILSELKDKVGALALGAGAGPAGATVSGGAEQSGNVSDAASALVNLGYNPSQALGAVARAAAQLGENAAVEALIRGGLGELAPADGGGNV